MNSKTVEWRSRLLSWFAGLLLFESLTGLSIFFLPFSVTNQTAVVLHTIVGLAFMVPALWYQIRHWTMYRSARMTHIKLTGYFATAAILVAVVSGVVLTGQALWGSRISYGWDLIHLLATFAVIATVVSHLTILAFYNLKGRKPEASNVRASEKAFARGTAWVAGSLAAVTALAAFSYEAPPLNNEFPEDYSYLYGEHRPFAPSLARTSTGGAFDAASLSGSESCGTSGCHEQIMAEWRVSAHRYSAMDPAFQTVQQVMAEQNGAESTRDCGGCHDPISLSSGTKNIFVEDLTGQAGYQEGVSCIACHSISETDVQGNANYIMTQPGRYMFETSETTGGRLISNFLIRAYPRYHVASLQHRLFKSAEFCAACHKQFIDEEINNVGWVQLQNQYDNWRESRWNHPGDPTETIECRECHMPLVESTDPSRGDDLDYNRHTDDGLHRSHRFLAANKFVPLILDLPGAAEHAELTDQWLRGQIEIPEIADKWTSGPAIPLELIAPRSALPGAAVRIQAVVTNNKPGHEFPTGPLDIIQAWVELVARDQNGDTLFRSGVMDERNFIEPGTFMFKAEPVDQYGNLIDRHNLWEMVGVRYRRSLFPGFSDRARYDIPIPDDGVTSIHVSARVMYRKADQYLLNFLFGEESGLTAPVTVISEAEATVAIGPRPSS
ncbi:MAG: multiheme c-type cytochrome [Gemmatimonadales bacterium]